MAVKIALGICACLLAHSRAHVIDYPGSDCLRDCDDTLPRICYYHFNLEHYHAMGPACGDCARGVIEDCFNEQCITADGKERGLMSINRKVPGPPIHVCKNDQIVVDVTNMMGGTSSTIHWHGFFQKQTPHMDGVPYVTQCPIQFGTTFRYSFNATEAGTLFYHSHSGHHKVNGHYGGIVVREPKANDDSASYYDHDLPEHLIVASDWMEAYGEMFMPGLPTKFPGVQPTSLLINGKGTTHDDRLDRISIVPLEVFRVSRDQRYRFRFVNSASHVCPLLLEIENHKIEIIATDSFNVRPVVVDSLITTSGERYDFVVNANQPQDHYWIRLRALGACESRQIEQFAVLSYAPESVSSIQLSVPKEHFPLFNDDFNRTILLNHPNTTCGHKITNEYCVTDLKSTEEMISDVHAQPDYRFYLGFNNIRQDESTFFKNNSFKHFMNIEEKTILVGSINKISFNFPPFSLLTQPEEVHDNLFCDIEHLPSHCHHQEVCHCVHRLKIKLNSTVELIIVDETSAINRINHPFHLHGHRFLVTSMGQHPKGIPMTVKLAKSMFKDTSILPAQKSINVIKDTISIPSRGYTILKFVADNPGFWLMHCHFEWHMAVGMALVLQVGETHEMVQAPDNFPKCNNYTPDV